MRDINNPEGSKRAPKLATLATAVVLAATSFADRASAEVRPGCNTEGTGTMYTPDLVVNEYNIPCAKYTHEERQEIEDKEGKGGADDTETPTPTGPTFQ
jgi:hypothetical protein